ncbi:hypothetical protein [Chitinimonas naiadis]
MLGRHSPSTLLLLVISTLGSLAYAAPQDNNDARGRGDRGEGRQFERNNREQIAPFRNENDQNNRTQQRIDRTPPVRPEPVQPSPPRPGRPDRPDRPGGGHWDHDNRPSYNGPHGYPVNRWYGPRTSVHIGYRPSFGTRFTVLPYGYRTVWVSGLTYYVADDIYYRREADNYVVVSPPDREFDDDAPSSGSTDQEPYIYPNRGQDDKQQALDRYECHRWAVKQTGFDPTEPEGGVDRRDALQKRDDYRRAESACLEGRGYTVR